MSASYMTFCPIAKACEVLEPRWTLLILSELFGGSGRFNEIRRGLPGMSPTLLSRRLKELEAAGLVSRTTRAGGRDIFYAATPMAEELRPIIAELGRWAHRNIDAEATLEHLDSRVLMWNIRLGTDIAAMPPARQWVVKFTFPAEKPENRAYWLVARRGAPADLCLVDPGQDVDLFVRAELRALTAYFLGYTTLRAEEARGTIELIGERALVESIGRWLPQTSLRAA